jgi:hypothetical protein
MSMGELDQAGSLPLARSLSTQIQMELTLQLLAVLVAVVMLAQSRSRSRSPSRRHVLMTCGPADYGAPQAKYQARLQNLAWTARKQRRRPVVCAGLDLGIRPWAIRFLWSGRQKLAGTI